MTVTNLGDAVTGWRLTWAFTVGQSITQLWNGSYTQSGAQVTVSNATYNGAIATGGTATFGFNGAWSGSNPVPASFALNGTVCTGTGGPSAPPSSAVSSTPPSSPPPGGLPCDIYAAGGTPCVTAHSTTRALLASYNGPLYQVQRASDKQYLDVGLLSAGGAANAAPQVRFCAGTTCTITTIYDQTANHNVGANAMALPVTVAGHQVYGVKVTSGVGYRIDHAKGAPTGAQPEGVYMVTSSNYVNNQCCFDYGSGENSHTDTGNATMNAIYWGTACWFGTYANNPCVGTGPWVEADPENGMYHTNTGGDNSPYGIGEFFEGAVIAGFPSDATEDAVQAGIVSAGYH